MMWWEKEGGNVVTHYLEFLQQTFLWQKHRQTISSYETRLLSNVKAHTNSTVRVDEIIFCHHCKYVIYLQRTYLKRQIEVLIYISTQVTCIDSPNIHKSSQTWNVPHFQHLLAAKVIYFRLWARSGSGSGDFLKCDRKQPEKTAITKLCS